ncbi:MAG TPA: NUDIX domain-containing protein [Ilumatobacteraceae bacterium]|nr:NUDIX domain-containing protein [Ilumatobacteraceae bacterium]HUV19131.1 NUDIX domain-containing protein [Ilumatobacteraceae bacterium]
MTRSAGIVLRRRTANGAVEVLLGHMGGPFWQRRQEGAWTIPKGEVEPGEEPLAVARREFHEELGMPVPPGDLVDLGEVRQAGGKVVRAWAVEGDLDVEAIVSNTFELEWPPKSGRIQSFPEIDRAAWFDLESARAVIVAGQRPLLDRLTTEL